MKKESQLEDVRKAIGAVAELHEKKSPPAPKGGLELSPEHFRTPTPEDKSRWSYERDYRYQTKINARKTPEFKQSTRRSPEKRNYGSRTFDPTSVNRTGSNLTWRKIRKQLNQDMNIVDISLEKKSESNNIPFNVLKEIFHRGILAWTKDSKFTPEQFAFNRVNSFISGGFARKLDEDLLNELSPELVGKVNKERTFGKKSKTKAASETLRKSVKKAWLKSNVGVVKEAGLKDACWKGYEAIGTKKKNGKTVPNCVPVKEEGGAGDIGTNELVNKYRSVTPGQQSRAQLVLKLAKEKNKS